MLHGSMLMSQPIVMVESWYGMYELTPVLVLTCFCILAQTLFEKYHNSNYHEKTNPAQFDHPGAVVWRSSHVVGPWARQPRDVNCHADAPICAGMVAPQKDRPMGQLVVPAQGFNVARLGR